MDDAECEESDVIWCGYETETKVFVDGFEEDTFVVDLIHLRSFKPWRDASIVRYKAKQRVREEYHQHRC